MTTSDVSRSRWVALGGVVIVASLIFLAVSGIGDNLVYYWSPAELVEKGEAARGVPVRLGGMVVAGSVGPIEGTELDFTLTDGVAEVRVHANELPPAMFREGVGVIVEGSMGSGDVFEANRLMVAHDNNYAPPEEGHPTNVEELSRSLSEAVP